MKRTKPVILLLTACLCMTLLFAGCTDQEPVARVGERDTVGVYYTGMFVNQTPFDTNINGDIFSFTIESGEVIPGFEEAVIGLAVGESITVTIPAAEAYGEWSEEYVLEVPRDSFPKNETLSPGMVFYMNDIYKVTVINITGETVFIDANHQLAGEDLVFEIELVSID